MVEESVQFTAERYMSIMLDGEVINLLLGSRGGVEVESYFSNAKDTFQAVRIDPAYGLGAYQVRKALENLDIDRAYWSSYVEIAEKLYRLFRASDATLAEINPLVEVAGKKLIALDARVIIDDGALYRQSEFADIDRQRDLLVLESGVMKQGCDRDRDQVRGCQYIKHRGRDWRVLLSNHHAKTTAAIESVCNEGENRNQHDCH